MTQIYVVLSQMNVFTGVFGTPVAAYSDYPTALAYAQTIFKPVFAQEYTAKDLVFLVNLYPTAAAATT
jgi:hypothetical protein